MSKRGDAQLRNLPVAVGLGYKLKTQDALYKKDNQRFDRTSRQRPQLHLRRDLFDAIISMVMTEYESQIYTC